jgi:hypothetical protein
MNPGEPPPFIRLLRLVVARSLTVCQFVAPPASKRPRLVARRDFQMNTLRDHGPYVAHLATVTALHAVPKSGFDAVAASAPMKSP